MESNITLVLDNIKSVPPLVLDALNERFVGTAAIEIEVSKDDRYYDISIVGEFQFTLDILGDKVEKLPRHLYTYKLLFSDGKKFICTRTNLDKAHFTVVQYMKKNKDLTQCLITCPTGIVRRVRKTGEWHWNHNGYSFD